MTSLSRETRIQIMLDEAELKVIDDWRFKQRMPSRAAAIRYLLQLGLDTHTGLGASERRPSRDYGILKDGEREDSA